MPQHSPPSIYYRCPLYRLTESTIVARHRSTGLSAITVSVKRWITLSSISLKAIVFLSQISHSRRTSSSTMPTRTSNNVTEQLPCTFVVSKSPQIFACLLAYKVSCGRRTLYNFCPKEVFQYLNVTTFVVPPGVEAPNLRRRLK